ncbi:allatostatin-A receptor-like isoform X2 [Ostrea edulis]|nr:allatostatin-A receptor-like isoform X2 [Ostrea edulis]XP_048764557.1 allatostatin-A receptor-like isoform X2 [Ostrea edulis]XP_048764558.1 allatostatin-A receptor-like isoform X2 [Ostrea edulis]XP_048764560.2 allatostatin-A receptor-like isoform X2 [Ostrea edulis]XP_048764561.2 allatostatin-A receptor-like isoform X2 [Ostrea edulis]XP_056019023.1 allatostatin-A receptor-like isoform X2 [Ostrea edulis]XP_056019024.1 allatostatin-A receptor-like isoform X2 [Ostrea edulis]XP_056019025.1 all
MTNISGNPSNFTTMLYNVSCENGTICNNTEEFVDIEAFLRFENLVRYIIPAIFGLIVILGFVGNVLVIFVVWSYKQMQNTTNILIVSLAVADLFFIIFCVPFTAASYAMWYWPFGAVWCKIANFLMHVSAYASVWTLVLLSLDRYLAVVHPIPSMRLRNRRNTYLLVYMTWTFIFCGNVPIFLQYGVVDYNWMGFQRSACLNLSGVKNKLVLKIFYGCFFAFGYMIPLTLICLLYGFLLKRLLYGVVPGGSQRADSLKAKKRVTKMVVIVVLIFALCWLPIQVIFLVQYLNTDFEVTIESSAIHMAANCLAYMNSCVNPILYAFLSENFRRSFRRLICCIPEPYSKFDYEKTNIRGMETKDTLLNNGSSKSKSENGKDRNCNVGEGIELKALTEL